MAPDKYLGDANVENRDRWKKGSKMRNNWQSMRKEGEMVGDKKGKGRMEKGV